MSHNKLSEKAGFLPSLWSDFLKGDLFTPEHWPRMVLPSVPAVNVKENARSFIVELAAPGFEKQDFNVGIEDGSLTISAEKKAEKSETKDKYTRKEFSSESFSRSFTLPDNILEEKIDAVYTNGMLQLTIPKKEQSQAIPKKTIEIM